MNASANPPVLERTRSLWAGGAVAVLLALLFSPSVSMERSMGWDESMHADLPALRILLAGQAGELGAAVDAIHGCDQYPFVYPLLLALVQAVTGPSELACRLFGRLLFALGLFGLFLLAREAARRPEGSAGDPREGWAPWLALLFGAASPMALAYSGTLFLEMPFVTASIFALLAWMKRDRRPSLRAEFLAGAWLALCFFVKFNYGLLLGFGLFLAWVVEAFSAARGERAPGEFARRSIVLAAAPLVAFVWWFLLPLPAGFDVAAAHRAALVAFLAGNRDAGMSTPQAIRVVHWTCFLAFTPRVLALQVVGVAASLAAVRSRNVRTLWIVFLAGGLPVWTHSFHLDRFLLPGAVGLWTLAALGLARVLPRSGRARWTAALALALLTVGFPGGDAWLVLRATGMASEREEVRLYQKAELADYRSLRGSRRVYTNGLSRAESEALLDLCAAEIRAGDRVGWVGISSVFSPAALHGGLLERGAGEPHNLRRQDLDRSFVELGFVDPQWSDERFFEWAGEFDLLLTTRPIDLTARGDREFMDRYRALLHGSPDHGTRLLGAFRVERPLRDPHDVAVFATRPLDRAAGASGR